MIESVAVSDELSTVTALFAWIAIVPSEMSVLSTWTLTEPAEVAVSVVFAFRLEASTVIADPPPVVVIERLPVFAFNKAAACALKAPADCTVIESVAVSDELSIVTALFAWIEIVPSEMSVLNAWTLTAPPEVAVSVVFAFRLEASTVIADPTPVVVTERLPVFAFNKAAA